MVDDLLAVPGLATLGTRERERLVQIASRNGWDPNWLAAAISHESGWQPKAKNSTSSASGIMQWTAATAKGLGTTTEAIRRMSVYEQLPLVETFFRSASGGRPIRKTDFLALAMGAAACPELEDACELYRAGSAGAKANPNYQNAEGAITVGRVRSELADFVGRYSKRLPVKTDREWATTGGPGLSRGVGLGAAAALSLAGIGFVWGTTRQRRRPRR